MAERKLDRHGRMPHRQCAYCNVYTYGPKAGRNPGRQCTHVTDAGRCVFDEDDPEMPPESQRNVSHGSCPDCNKALASFRRREGRWPELPELMEERGRVLNPPWDPPGENSVDPIPVPVPVDAET